MSVLGRDKILEAMQRDSLADRLVVTPLLSVHQLGPASLDITLGHEFIVTRRTNIPFHDRTKRSNEDARRFEYRYYVERKRKFYLHPNELILASTVEWFRLPNNIAGYVTSRSSWGRAGLVIATAVAVHPGFTGTLTLELMNDGAVPLVLYPGLKVAQFIFLSCEGGGLYAGDHALQTGPQSALDKQEADRQDLEFWTSED